MDRIEFKYALVDVLNEMSSDGALISLKKVLCNNGVIREGITISGKKGNTRPVLYLDDLYEKYREKGEMKTIAADILHEDSLYCGNITCVTEYDFDRVLDNVYFRLVNRRMNMAKLKSMPHFDFLDMSGIYYILINEDRIKDGMVNVDNRLMDIWKGDPEELYIRAVNNTSERLPLRIEPVTRFITPLYECDEPSLYVVTNEKSSNGASVMAYPYFKDALQKRFGCDLYLIPSSVHELLAMPVDGYDPERLKEVIRHVNDTQLCREDLLGYELYRYSCEENGISVV